MHEAADRSPRRPPGWCAPGPPPAAHGPIARAGERHVYLSGDWRLLQRVDGHHWSLDDLVTAWCAATACDQPAPRILDLGCGLGAVLLLLAWRFPAARLVGIEAQATSVDLARRSAAWNGAAPRCEVRHGDLRHAAGEAGGFDLVSGTPPYLPLGRGALPRRAQQVGCHFEARGGIEDYCRAAARALAPGGAFVCCHNDVERTLAAARAAGLAAERCQPVVPRSGKAPLFALFVLRRGAGRAPRPEAPLIVRGADGQWSAAFRAVRRDMGMPERPHDGA